MMDVVVVMTGSWAKAPDGLDQQQPRRNNRNQESLHGDTTQGFCFLYDETNDNVSFQTT